MEGLLLYLLSRAHSGNLSFWTEGANQIAATLKKKVKMKKNEKGCSQRVCSPLQGAGLPLLQLLLQELKTAPAHRRKKKCSVEMLKRAFSDPSELIRNMN